jgi:hypothetical protein
MRTRILLGLFLTTLGLVLVAASLSAAVLHYDLRGGSGLVAAISILFLVLGVIVLIMDIFEVWLNRGQPTLVDGLQAG